MTGKRQAWVVHATSAGSSSAASWLHRVLDWLREGYPEGVPGTDRVPLLALLRETPLTEEQLKEVIRHILASDSPALADGTIGNEEIEHFVSEVTHHDAGPENIRRVAARLAAAGWPLAGMAGSGEVGQTADGADAGGDNGPSA
jgi:Protein of unknown function (DUF3349)